MHTDLMSEAPRGHVHRANQQVLLVDDDRALRFHARQVLEGFGLNVIEAGSGQEAIVQLKQTPFDLVLLDVQMPGLDGFETCREIRSLADGELLPVVMITGLEDYGSIEYAYQVGATDFTTKPINWPILKNRIRYLIGSRRTSMDLQSTEAERRALLSIFPDTVFRLDELGRVVDINPAQCPMTALAKEMTIGCDFSSLLAPAAADSVRRCLEAVRRDGGTQQCEFEWQSGCETNYYDVRMVASGTHEIVMVLRDFTDRHQAERRIRHIAFYDELTGLPKLSWLNEQLQASLQSAGQDGALVAAVRIEMADQMQLANMLSSEAVDELMRLWGARLAECAQAVHHFDVFVARVGGPVFALLVSGIHRRDELNAFVDEVRSYMEQPFQVGGYELMSGIRLGVAVYPTDDFDGTQLLEKAGMAVEESTRAGQLGVNYYTAETRSRTLGRICLTRELKTAIEQGDLYLDYQPKVDSMSNRLVGVEALVRWNSVSRGQISPTEFIPLAEESGLILPLGEYVLSEACGQVRHWRESGCGAIPVAVNFSGHQFNQQGLLGRIRDTLDRFSVDSRHVEVEMTESVAIDNSVKMKEILEELRQLGMRTAIDDFGTGYSSLSSLRHFPFSILKIDRSFIQHVTTNPTAASITEMIIAMGHVLGMEVVAEGVENEQQLAFLREKRCDVIQGFFTGRPTDAQGIAEFARRQVGNS